MKHFWFDKVKLPNGEITKLEVDAKDICHAILKATKTKVEVRGYTGKEKILAEGSTILTAPRTPGMEYDYLVGKKLEVA